MTHLSVWLIAGIILSLLELIIPGGIVIFLGLGSLTVALSIYMGWVTAIPAAIFLWLMVSLVYLLVLRGFFMKYFEGDTTIDNTDEDEKFVGKIVDVVEEILPHKEGRIKFRDTTWGALSLESFKSGEKAKIIERDGNKWIVGKI